MDNAIIERHKSAVRRFQRILRSGKDYTVESMCETVGKSLYMSWVTVRDIVTRHYKQAVTSEMIEFVKSLECSRDEELDKFSEKFNVCKRESILLIRYVRRRR